MKNVRRIAMLVAVCALLATVMAGTALAAKPVVKGKTVAPPAPIGVAQGPAVTDTVCQGTGQEYFILFKDNKDSFTFYVDPVGEASRLQVETLSFKGARYYWAVTMDAGQGEDPIQSSTWGADWKVWYKHQAPVLNTWAKGGKITITRATEDKPKMPRDGIGVWVRFTYWGCDGMTVGYDFPMPPWPIPDC